MIRAAAVTAAITLGVFITPLTSASGQSGSSRPATWELRLPSGAFVPTGDLRNTLKNAQASAIQLAWLVRPQLALVGSFTWARSRDITLTGSPKLDVFNSDLGVEARTVDRVAGAVTLSAFAGIGAGARSYNYRKLDVNATNNLAAFGSVGGEAGIGRFGLRLEARDYATGFRPLIGGGTSEARNDVVIMATVRFNRRRATQDQQ